MLLQAHFTVSQEHYSQQFADLRLLSLAAHIGARMKLYKFFSFKRSRPSYRYLPAQHESCTEVEEREDVGMVGGAKMVGKPASVV